MPSPIGLTATRRRSMRTTWSLAGVLLTLGAFVVWGDLTTTKAADAQSEALAVAGLFQQAQYTVAVQGLYARQYRLQPSSAVRRRYDDAARQTADALTTAQRTGDLQASGHATDLLELERRFARAAERMIDAVASGSTSVDLIDNLEVAPAYFSLQQQVNDTAAAYRLQAQQRVRALRMLQQRLLVGTVVGFGAGLLLLTMIWRLVLGYQRNLTVHADTNAHLALHDPLTGLPNRALFAHELNRLRGDRVGPDADTDARLASPAGVAVMVLDLDRFKEVNDTLGHHAGDQLLVEVGHRLREVLRHDDLLARLGGDEFAVLLPAVDDVDSAVEVAERAATVLREPFALDNSPAPVAVPASIGVAFAPGPTDMEALVQRADAAMYRAKAGHFGVAVYDHEIDHDDPDRLVLFGRLRHLLETGDPDGELFLFYQPQIRLEDAQLHGVEALVRWRHPTQGLLLPGDFLPLAEETGLEVPLTYHLLGMAAAQAAGWAATGQPIPVAVNVSPDCLVDPQFADTVRAVLERTTLPASLLRLEVTEGSMMDDPQRSQAVLHSLKRSGVTASVDDFGSGYSSLGQLRRMPVGELKIDKSFVRDLSTEQEDVLLVRTAISLGHHHGTVVVAEGVEDEAALRILAELGCDAVQGFLLSRPVPPDDVRSACRAARAIVQACVDVPAGTSALQTARG